eukprot:INCI17584.2.p1 GENE.INCI17584.2~~INCI17584.2.p1  ORF type:complete len:949 (-),score=166.65 INCI17584.2:1819-4665(-)
MSRRTARVGGTTVSLTGADLHGVQFSETSQGQVHIASPLPASSQFASVLHPGDVVAAVNGEATSKRVTFLVLQQLQGLSMTPRSRVLLTIVAPQPGVAVLAFDASNVDTLAIQLSSAPLFANEHGKLVFEASTSLAGELVPSGTVLAAVSGRPDSPTLESVVSAVDSTKNWNLRCGRRQDRRQVVFRIQTQNGGSGTTANAGHEARGVSRLQAIVKEAIAPASDGVVSELNQQANAGETDAMDDFDGDASLTSRVQDVECNIAHLRDFAEAKYFDARETEAAAKSTIASLASATLSAHSPVIEGGEKADAVLQFDATTDKMSAASASPSIQAEETASAAKSAAASALFRSAKAAAVPLRDPIHEPGATKTVETLRFEDWRASHISLAPSFRHELARRDGVVFDNMSGHSSAAGKEYSARGTAEYRRRYAVLQQQYGLTISDQSAEHDFISQVMNRLLNFSLPQSQATATALLALDFGEYLNVPYVARIPHAKTVPLSGIELNDVIVAWRASQNHQYTTVKSATEITEILKQHMEQPLSQGKDGGRSEPVQGVETDQGFHSSDHASESAGPDGSSVSAFGLGDELSVLLHNVQKTQYHCEWHLRALTDSRGQFFQQEKMLFVKLHYQDHVTQIQAQHDPTELSAAAATPGSAGRAALATSVPDEAAEANALANAVDFVFDLGVVEAFLRGVPASLQVDSQSLLGGRGFQDQLDEIRYLFVDIVNLNNKVVASGRIDVAAALGDDAAALLAGDEVSRIFEIELTAAEATSASASVSAVKPTNTSAGSSASGAVFARAAVQGSFYKLGRFASVSCSREFGLGSPTKVDPTSGLLQLQPQVSAEFSGGSMSKLSAENERVGPTQDRGARNAQRQKLAADGEEEIAPVFVQTVPNAPYTSGMRRGHLLTRVDDVRVTATNFTEIQVSWSSCFVLNAQCTMYGAPHSRSTHEPA